MYVCIYLFTTHGYIYTKVYSDNRLGVVHNCQHLPISTQSTNLGGGRGAEAR